MITMNEIQQQVLEALKRNLFLKETLRQKIVLQLPTLSGNQCERLKQLLTTANANQDETLKSILEKEPYFFYRVEQSILHTMSDEFDRLSQAEIEQAEAQLLEDIKNYKA
jgi:hypothetical protein